MRLEILEALQRELPKEPHTPLPSVRVLARHFSASALTVQRALHDLVDLGLAYSLPRKGYYWGSEPKKIVPLPTTLPERERVRAELRSDLQSGVFHPFHALPGPKVLAVHYGISTGLMRQVLSESLREGLLRRERRCYYLPITRVHPDSACVGLVVRCDARGHLRLDSERERAFFRDVQDTVNERALRLVVLGCYEDGFSAPILLDRGGRPVVLSEIQRPLLGFLVSTWLVHNPLALLHLLRAEHAPLAVWWEHPVTLVPRLSREAKVAFFNVAFGDAPGRAVGEYLRGLGYKRVVFLSPFHGSEWSKGRLRGLVDGLGRGHFGNVMSLVSERWDSPWDLIVQEGRGEGMRRALAHELEKLLAQMRSNEVEALVCVNDMVAACAEDILGAPSIHLVGFDYSAEGLRRRFDSFAFNTSGMARQMLYHLLQPSAGLFAQASLQEVVGRLVPGA